MARNLLKLAVGALALSSVSGCLSVLPEVEAPEALYRIEPHRPALELAANLVIREPDASQVLAGQAMVSQDGSGAIRLLPNVEWAGRSTQLMQTALLDSFSASGAGAALLPQVGADAPFEVSSRVSVLEVQGTNAVCQARVDLLRVIGRTVIDRRAVAVSEPVSGTSTVDRAQALKRAAERCVSEIAVFVASGVNAAGKP